MSVLFAILLFSFLVFIHELGHFVAAKLSGVQVNEFSLFMGPAIFKKQVGETLYALRCIPMGGYCAMEGENEDTENPRSFQKAAWWKRLIILVAGAAMNFIAGFLIFACLYVPGSEIVEPAIVDFTDCCIFNTQDGLHEGDVILELDGEKVYINGDISLILQVNNKVHHDVKVLRDGEVLKFRDLEMAHTHVNEDGEEYLHYGFTFGQLKEVGFFQKLHYAWKVTVDNVRNIRLSLKMLFTGQAGMKDMTGVVGLVHIMSDVAAESDSTKTAILNMLSFGGMIAVNLAVMNLLPIPALDGGRVVCLLLTPGVEAITKKKINPKYEGYLHGVGLVLLIGLMVVIMFKDVFFIFKG